jgi:CBS domain-containing protein
MPTVRDVMCDEVEVLQLSNTAADAAFVLASRGIGVIPLCQPDGRLAGTVSDRDIVVKVVAMGKDPKAFSLADLAELSEAVAVGLDDPVEDAAAVMTRYQIERLPVIDNDRVVGLVKQVDIARSLSFGRSWADL